MAQRRTPLSDVHHDAASCTLDVRVGALGHVPFFADLSETELVEINGRTRIADYGEGEPVIHAGDPASHIYVVASGAAKVVRPSLDGTDVLLDIARPGDFFGMLPSLGETTYADSVWALTPLCVLDLDAATFEAILDEHPSVARAGLRVMAERLERARNHIHAVAVATSEQRVAAALVMLAGRVGVRRPNGLLLDLPLTRDDLAALTGTASETVSRILARLQRDQIINSGRRWIEIVDLPALESLAVI